MKNVVKGSYKPRPHPIKFDLQRHQITQGAAARYAGVSYQYFCDQVNGVSPLPKRVERKVQELINSVSDGA